MDKNKGSLIQELEKAKQGSNRPCRKKSQSSTSKRSTSKSSGKEQGDDNKSVPKTCFSCSQSKPPKTVTEEDYISGTFIITMKDYIEQLIETSTCQEVWDGYLTGKIRQEFLDDPDFRPKKKLRQTPSRKFSGVNKKSRRKLSKVGKNIIDSDGKSNSYHNRVLSWVKSVVSNIVGVNDSSHIDSSKKGFKAVEDQELKPLRYASSDTIDEKVKCLLNYLENEDIMSEHKEEGIETAIKESKKRNYSDEYTKPAKTGDDLETAIKKSKKRNYSYEYMKPAKTEEDLETAIKKSKKRNYSDGYMKPAKTEESIETALKKLIGEKWNYSDEYKKPQKDIETAYKKFIAEKWNHSGEYVEPEEDKETAYKKFIGEKWSYSEIEYTKPANMEENTETTVTTLIGEKWSYSEIEYTKPVKTEEDIETAVKRLIGEKWSFGNEYMKPAEDIETITKKLFGEKLSFSEQEYTKPVNTKGSIESAVKEPKRQNYSVKEHTRPEKTGEEIENAVRELLGEKLIYSENKYPMAPEKTGEEIENAVKELLEKKLSYSESEYTATEKTEDNIENAVNELLREKPSLRGNKTYQDLLYSHGVNSIFTKKINPLQENWEDMF